MEITKGENANLAGMEPRCPKCGSEVTWWITSKDCMPVVRCRAEKCDEIFRIKELSDFAQFFRSPAPTPPLDVEAAAQEINEDEITRIRTGRSRLTEKGIADILRRHIASPAPERERGPTMKRENIRMMPAGGDEECRTHAQRATGNDHTLCGFTLDGDPTCVEWEETTEDPITCETCWAIIEFCRSIKQRKIAVERGSKA